MAEPLGGRLRAARRSGLTSPDPGQHPHAARHTAASPDRRTPDKPQNRQRQGKHTLNFLTEPNNQNEFSRWIEAERWE
jgi:hypothetical protein